jgi:hypothetical protein
VAATGFGHEIAHSSLTLPRLGQLLDDPHLKHGFGLICPLLSGPISILGMATKEEWNGKKAQAGRHHWQAA